MCSIPDEIFETLNLLNHSGHTMALWSTLPLTEMSTRDLPGVKGSQCVGLTTHLHVLTENPGSFNLLEPLGPI
jgi:hypothetical protein